MRAVHESRPSVRHRLVRQTSGYGRRLASVGISQAADPAISYGDLHKGALGRVRPPGLRGLGFGCGPMVAPVRW